jgi:hypothetical protein
VVAFRCTEGGSAGPIAAAAGARLGSCPTGPDGVTGVTVLERPPCWVIVTVFVVLLMTTVLWMLLKITLLEGGGAT